MAARHDGRGRVDGTLENSDAAAPSSRFPASRTVYVEGTQPEVRVPMREIALSPTKSHPHGPATDPNIVTDVRQGLSPFLVEGQVLEAGGTRRRLRRRERGVHAGDDHNHIDKHAFRVPFVCGARDLSEARRPSTAPAAPTGVSAPAGARA